MLSILLLARCLLLIHGSTEEGGDASCPADGGGASCRQPSGVEEGSTAATGRWSGVKEPHNAPPGEEEEELRTDLVAQEVEELKDLIRLNGERIELLKDLRESLAASERRYPVHLPESRIRALREPLPWMADIASEAEHTPTAVAEDFLISKAVIPSSEEVKFVKVLPTVNRRSSSSSSSTAIVLPTALVVMGRADGTVMLYTPQGRLALSFSTGHEQPVTHLAVSPSHEEHLVVTGDAGGGIRMHKVDVRQRRGQREQKKQSAGSTGDKISKHLTLPANVTAQLLRQMQMPEGGSGETLRITALAVASQGGSRYVLAGDDEGSVSMFLRNGTLRTRLEVTLTERGVDSLSTNAGGGALFRSGEDWGYLDVQKMQVRHVDYCPQHFGGGLESVALDPQTSSRVLAADGNGTVWVLSVKEKRECWVETRFATRSRIDLASVHGFAIGLERGRRPGEPTSLVALNMSHVSSKAKAGGGKPPGIIPPVATSAVVWRKARPPVQAWSVLRRSKEGDLLVFLSEDGKEVEIMELLMQVYQAPSMDSFGNFQMPVVAVAVVLVLGYQYMKQKGKGSGGGGFGGKKGLGNEDFVSALRNKRKLNELRSSKSKFP